MLERIRKLKSLYDSGAIPTLEVHEVHPNLDNSSREHYLYFTLAPVLNFQRDSVSLWKSALKTYLDTETRYVFFPEDVVRVSFPRLQRDMAKYGLALQRNKHPQIWLTISEALNEDHNSDPRRLLEDNFNDVEFIQEHLIANKKRYPYLNGPKMRNYWLYILHQFTNIELRNIDKITIIPDIHVRNASEKLGIITADAKPDEIADTWGKLLIGSEILPAEMHPVLWNWSRNGFQPIV